MEKQSQALFPFKRIIVPTLLLFFICLLIEKYLYHSALDNGIVFYSLRVADLSIMIVLSLFLMVQYKFEQKTQTVEVFCASMICLSIFTFASLFRSFAPSIHWSITIGSLIVGIILNLPRISTSSKPINVLILCVPITIVLFSFHDSFPMTFDSEGQFSHLYIGLNFLAAGMILAGCFYFYKQLESNETEGLWIRPLVLYFSFIALTRLLFPFTHVQDLKYWLIHVMRFGSNLIAVYYLLAAYYRSLHINQENQKIIEQQRAKLVHSSQMSSVARLSGIMAHEINNPLTSISLITEFLLMRNKDPLSENQKIKIQKINMLTGRISETIKRFLDLSGIGEKNLRSTTHLETIIHDTTKLCGSSLTNNLELKIYPIPDVEITCIPSHVSQALLNLLMNSYDAIKNLSERWIHVQFEKHHDRVIIRVVDSGKPIDAQVADNMMDPFFTTKDVNEGPGLGLSIAKSYIETENGHLYYDRKWPNTCFTIELPIAESASRSEGQSPLLNMKAQTSSSQHRPPHL